MYKFQPGDKVVCVDVGDWPNLVLGEIYTIKARGFSTCFHLEETYGQIAQERFKLVSRPVTPMTDEQLKELLGG